MADKKVVKFEKNFHPNLAFFLFLLIVIYIVVLAWSFFGKEHISIYEVNSSDISDDSPLYGFVSREEEIVKTEDTGYINYYCSEGNRIGKGDVAYTVDASGEVNQLLEQIQSERDNSENIIRMRNVIATFQNSFSMSGYNDVTRLKYDAKNVLFDMNSGSLYSDLKKALSSAGKRKSFTKVSAKKSGIIAYTMDGYENIMQRDITADIFDEYGNVARKQLQKNGMIESGTPVYKLITSNDWSVYVKLDESYYQALKDQSFVRVTVLKDDISFNAALEIFDRGTDHFAKLSTSRFMEHYINDRFLQIEFNIKSASGLKIPNSSILQKEYYKVPKRVVTQGTEGIGVVKQTMDDAGEKVAQFTSIKKSFLIDDNYYVDPTIVQGGDILVDSSTGENYIVSQKQKLSGVYYVNEGYCKFKPIEILYENKEYTIVSPDTVNGLSAFDHIVVDPSSLSDDDFIE